MEILLEKQDTHPAAIPWLIRWAKSFFRELRGKPLENTGPDDICNFMQILGSRPSIQKFQLKQADQALKLPICNQSLHNEVKQNMIID